MTTLNEEQLAAPSENFQYYIDQYKILHTVKKDGGGVYTDCFHISPTYTSRDMIKTMLEEHNVKTLLDYGIAQGVQYTKGKLDEYWGLESYTGYDPAVERYSQKPTGKFDAVLCYDVLEHIPEGSIDYVMQEIFSYTDKVILLHVGLGPAQAKLPNGENAHITIKPREWWIEKINKYKREGQVIYFHKFVL